MSSFEMICTLRQRLLTGIEQRDIRELNGLHVTFAALRELAIAAGQVTIINLLTDLEYAAGYAGIGASAKALALIPTEEAIRAQFEAMPSTAARA